MADKYVDDLEVNEKWKPKRGIWLNHTTADGAKRLLTDKIPYRNDRRRGCRNNRILIRYYDIKTELAPLKQREKLKKVKCCSKLMENIDTIAVQGYSPDGVT